MPMGFFSWGPPGFLRNRLRRLTGADREWGGRSLLDASINSPRRFHRGRAVFLLAETTGTCGSDRGRPVRMFQAFQLIALLHAAPPGGPEALRFMA